MPRRPRVSRRSRASSRPRSSRLVHTGVAVSTWNRISSCCTPGSPPSICARSGPACTAVPTAGSRSRNSSSTPSVMPPAARAVPDGSPPTVTSGPAPPGPGAAGHLRRIGCCRPQSASCAGSAGSVQAVRTRPGGGPPGAAISQTIVCNSLGLTIIRRRGQGKGQMSRRPGDDRPPRAGGRPPTLSPGLRREPGLNGSSRGRPFPVTPWLA